jgi:hypothetical protein
MIYFYKQKLNIRIMQLLHIRVIRGSKDTIFTIDYGCEKYPKE